LRQHVELAEAIVAGKPREAEVAAAQHIRFTFETVEEIRRDELRLETSLSRVNRRDLIAD
jgi:GntR family transcriptional repressor for pyruvate dehydrogenase complex